MKPTIEQIDAAESFINEISENREKLFAKLGIKKRLPPEETILFALRFTKKMMGEPSDEMGLSLYTERKQTSGLGRRYARSDWGHLSMSSKRSWMVSIKAMVNQAIKEVEDEKI